MTDIQAETQYAEFNVGDKVRIMILEGLEYDQETGEFIADNRPTGTIASEAIDKEIPDIVQHAHVYMVDFDDQEKFPISPLPFIVEALELIEQPKTAGKKASESK
jgi:3-dehydroquinate synthase class II